MNTFALNQSCNKDLILCGAVRRYTAASDTGANFDEQIYQKLEVTLNSRSKPAW